MTQLSAETGHIAEFVQPQKSSSDAKGENGNAAEKGPEELISMEYLDLQDF